MLASLHKIMQGFLVICKFTRLSITVPSCNDSCVHQKAALIASLYPLTFGLASGGPDSSLSSSSAASPSWESWPDS